MRSWEGNLSTVVSGCVILSRAAARVQAEGAARRAANWVLLKSVGAVAAARVAQEGRILPTTDGPMNQTQINLVQQSFAQASRIGPHVAATFYAELFAIDPSLRALFKGDILIQAEKLWTMLSHVVAHLAEPEVMETAARELAIRHLRYGVEAHHYAAVGTALLRTLRHELGASFTGEARAAWIAAYRHLSDTMRAAAYGPGAERGV